MGPRTAPPRGRAGSSRWRRWLGWNRDIATVAIGLDDDVATVLCLRRRAVITASGRIDLPPGTVRNGRLLMAGPAIDALTRLRGELHLPDRSRTVVLVRPRAAVLRDDTVVAEVDTDERVARIAVAESAGFAAVVLDPVPAALARLGPSTDQPVYADGAGWRTYRHDGHLEVEPSDRARPEVVVGPSPVDREPLTDPDPIAVDPEVDLLAGWPLLVGAALTGAGGWPAGRIVGSTATPTGGWSIERVAGPAGPACPGR